MKDFFIKDNSMHPASNLFFSKFAFYAGFDMHSEEGQYIYQKCPLRVLFDVFPIVANGKPLYRSGTIKKVVKGVYYKAEDSNEWFGIKNIKADNTKNEIAKQRVLVAVKDIFRLDELIESDITIESVAEALSGWRYYIAASKIRDQIGFDIVESCFPNWRVELFGPIESRCIDRHLQELDEWREKFDKGIIDGFKQDLYYIHPVYMSHGIYLPKMGGYFKRVRGCLAYTQIIRNKQVDYLREECRSIDSLDDYYKMLNYISRHNASSPTAKAFTEKFLEVFPQRLIAQSFLFAKQIAALEGYTITEEIPTNIEKQEDYRIYASAISNAVNIAKNDIEEIENMNIDISGIEFISKDKSVERLIVEANKNNNIQTQISWAYYCKILREIGI